MKSDLKAVTGLLPAACFVAGANGVFVLAGASSGELDFTLALPLVLAVLSLFLTRADLHFKGPQWVLHGFALCGLIEMPVLPLLAASGHSALVSDGILPGILHMLLLALFCMAALMSRKSTQGARA